jgi:cytochrome P460
VGSSQGHNVYINPDAYREYSKSGKFPEGTILVQEMVATEVVKASVKDSGRFEGGWGYFDFSEGTGALKSEAEPLPQTAGCLSCHQEKAATDHVFTQFYPVLRNFS